MKNEIEKYVGKKGFIKVNNTMNVEVEIKDVKLSYGNYRFLISPISGNGSSWVQSVMLPPENDDTEL